jgi:DNA polymerase III epsilon subunit family exonuclease
VRERLYEHLIERPGGATPAELLGLVFMSPPADAAFADRFLSIMLSSDPRFVRADDGRWQVRAHELAARTLRGLSFVVVDLETTGGAPGASGITEIGAVRVVDGRLTDEFATLVNPGRRIPPFVVALTGITDEMVADAPPIAEALPRFLEFAGDAVLVAHNAGFDMAHLNAAHSFLTGRTIDANVLCTIRLARRLMPDLRRRSLDSVAGALGLSCYDRHRGLGDARITAEILCVFLEKMAERGLTRLDEVLELQRQAADGRPWEVHVPREVLDALPETPGVYHFFDEQHRLLYVGKAGRLRDRVGSWFVQSHDHSNRALEMIRQVRDVRVTETGSELGAALLEMRHIHDLRPHYNRAQRQLPRVAFLKVGLRSPFPRLSITQKLRADRAIYVGPLANIDAARRAQMALARVFGLRTCAPRLTPSPDVVPCHLGDSGACSAPCAARADEAAYRAQVDGLVAFLHGDDRMRDAATDADRGVLDELRMRHKQVSCVVARQNFVVLLPTADRTAAQLYAVLGGRLALESRVEAAADLLAAVRVVRERWTRYQDAPLERADVDASTVLAAWLRDRAQEGLLLQLDGPDALAERLDDLVITVQDLRQRGPLPQIDGLR